jgi:serine/threonine-protein kinase
VKILDFGIAKVVATATQTSKTKVMGTPLYMSPEQINGDGKIGPPADLYALAHIAFTLLVGRPYWEEDANEIEGIFGFLLKLMEGIDVPATRRAKSYGGVELPEAFDAWFEKSTAPQAGDRFQSAREQIDALAEALDRTIPTPVDMSGDFTAAFGLDTVDARSHSEALQEERSPTQLDAALDTRAITEGDETIRDDVRPSGISPRSMGLAAVAAVILGLGGAALMTSRGDGESALRPAGSAASADSDAKLGAAAQRTDEDRAPTPEPGLSSSSAPASSASAEPSTPAASATPPTPTPTPTRRPPPVIAPAPPAPPPSPPKPAPSSTIDPLKVR